MRKCLAWLLMALCGSSSSAATISHQRNGDTELIWITGDIKSGDEAEFSKLAVQYDKAIVGLSSNGGALLPGLAIGTALHLRGFDTAVVAGNQCASACALIWVAGVDRYIVKGARVGFHASYVEDGGKALETGLGNALVGRYLTQLGLTERAVIFATASHPTDIAWLAREADGTASGIPFSFWTPPQTTAAVPIAKANEPKSNGPYREVGVWSIYKNPEDCTAIASYKSGFFLIRYNAKTHGTVVAFSYPEGSSLNEGDEKTLEIKLVKQDGTVDAGWTGIKFVVSLVDGIRTLYSKPLSEPAMSDLSDTKTLGFYYNGKFIYAYNLINGRDVLAEVVSCSRQVNKIDPRDVFAN